MSDDLIRRSDAIKVIMETCCYCSETEVLTEIRNLPTIEPKQGEWKISNLPKGEMKYCSECGFGQYIKDERMYNFCPNCGADMREREGE